MAAGLQVGVCMTPASAQPDPCALSHVFVPLPASYTSSGRAAPGPGHHAGGRDLALSLPGWLQLPLPGHNTDPAASCLAKVAGG